MRRSSRTLRTGGQTRRLVGAHSRAFVLAALLPVLISCGAPGERDTADTLTVGAATGLATVLPELVSAFTEESGIRVTVTLGSTGQLAQQIRAGAPLDVLLAADRAWVEALDAQGRLKAERHVFALGSLVLYGREADMVRPGPYGLRSSAVRRVAIANPRTAPYGRAARQALESLELWSEIQPKLVLAENARQAAQWAETGNVDAALVPRSLVSEDRGHWTELRGISHEPLEQTVAIVAGTRHPDEARAFATFLRSEAARAVLEAHGLAAPPP